MLIYMKRNLNPLKAFGLRVSLLLASANNNPQKYWDIFYTKHSSLKFKQKVIRKYHTQILQTNPRHREVEPQNTNSHKIPGRQLKQNKATISLSLPRHDDGKTRKDPKKCITTKNKQTQNPYKQWKENKTMNKEQQNYRLRTDSSLSLPKLCC